MAGGTRASGSGPLATFGKDGELTPSADLVHRVTEHPFQTEFNRRVSASTDVEDVRERSYCILG